MDSSSSSAAVIILADGRMTPRSAANYVGLSEKTMATKRCDGSGPPYVKLGRVFYFKSDLDRWIDSQRARSTAQARLTITQRPAALPRALEGAPVNVDARSNAKPDTVRDEPGNA